MNPIVRRVSTGQKPGWLALGVRFRAASVVGLVCVAVTAAGSIAAKNEASAREDTAVAPLSELVPDESLDQRLLAVPLSGSTWERRVEELDQALFFRESAQRVSGQSATALAKAMDALAAATTELSDAQRSAASLDERIETQISAIQARAVSRFIGFGEDTELEALGSVEQAARRARAVQLADAVDENQLDELRNMNAERDQLDRNLTLLGWRRTQLEARVGSLRLANTLALDQLVFSAEAVPAAIDAVRRARRSARIDGMDMSVVALDAYLKAEATLSSIEPGCRIEWWMIAGVGRVESRHGEIGRRSLRADGRPSNPIIGIALDGGPGVRAIADTDGGSLDGDDVWDRALGPMQFIPETWRRRSLDGNGDGVADPQNLYDSALTAGRFLCRLGGDLSAGGNLEAAYFGYNTSDEYVASVSGYAASYASFPLPILVQSQGSETQTVDGVVETPG